MISDIEHLFICLLAICLCVPFGEISIQVLCLFFKKRFYLFVFRERRREGEREGEKHQCARETSMCGCLAHTPHWGPDLQPRHVF